MTRCLSEIMGCLKNVGGSIWQFIVKVMDKYILLDEKAVSELLKQIMKWSVLVIDDAQNIKNPYSEQTKAIKSIDAMHKIAMSGTPIENRLLEYWSIFDFTNKMYLGTLKQFKDRYASPIEKERNEGALD